MIGIIPGVYTVWEERDPIGMELGVTHVVSLGSSDIVRGRE